MFEKILVPIDRSGLSTEILALVEPIARAHGSQVRTIRVLDLYEIDDALLRGVDIFEDTRSSLEVAVSPLLQAGIDSRFEFLESDDPAARILAYASEWGASLIALATNGRMGADRWAQGSVAEDVARASLCPTLVANPRALRAWRGWQTLLVPLDGSHLAERAVAPAADLARAFGAKVVLFHARDEVLSLDPGDDSGLLARDREALSGIDVKTVSAKGSAGYGILAAARAEEADAVVLTTHGRSGIARWMLGSVAEHVLEHGTLPVLIVPGRDGGALESPAVNAGTAFAPPVS